MTEFYVAKVHNNYAVFGRKTGAADTIFDTQEEAKIHCDMLNRDLQVKSAAHEMLAALREAEEWMENTIAGAQEQGCTVDVLPQGYPHGMESVRAAIAKAGGRR